MKRWKISDALASLNAAWLMLSMYLLGSVGGWWRFPIALLNLVAVLYFWEGSIPKPHRATTEVKELPKRQPQQLDEAPPYTPFGWMRKDKEHAAQ